MLKDHKRGRTRRVVCLDCYAMLRCHKCRTAYEVNYWTRHERDNNGRRGTALVCKACRTLGYHPADLETYSCLTCQRDLGAQKFNRQLLKNYKHHKRSKLECTSCASVTAERVRRLRRLLQQSTRKCRCFCRIHQSKCPLTPVIFGEKRWPGSDGAISAGDRKFLDALHPPPAWWSKAWGR